MSEPSARWGQFCSSVRGRLYLWGGCDIQENAVHIFDPFSETWSHSATTGPCHPATYDGACCAAADGNLYLYGGGTYPKYSGTLNRFNTVSCEWTKLSSTGPTSKDGCRMASCGDKLVLFGGYGFVRSIQQGSNYSACGHGGVGGWTNELHVFDLKEGRAAFTREF